MAEEAAKKKAELIYKYSTKGMQEERLRQKAAAEEKRRLELEAKKKKEAELAAIAEQKRLLALEEQKKIDEARRIEEAKQKAIQDEIQRKKDAHEKFMREQREAEEKEKNREKTVEELQRDAIKNVDKLAREKRLNERRWKVIDAGGADPFPQMGPLPPREADEYEEWVKKGGFAAEHKDNEFKKHLAAGPKKSLRQQLSEDEAAKKKLEAGFVRSGPKY